MEIDEHLNKTLCVHVAILALYGIPMWVLCWATALALGCDAFPLVCPEVQYFWGQVDRASDMYPLVSRFTFPGTLGYPSA